MKVLNTDEYIYSLIINPISKHFEHVNPNFITVLSMPLSFCIFLFNWCPPFGIIIAILTNILRTLCDFLDGHIARKFNKCSKLGALLDTIADVAHSVNYVMFFIVTIFPSITRIIFAIIWIGLFVIGYYSLWKKGVVFDHDNMGKLKSNPIDLFIAIGKYDGFLLNIFMISSLSFLNIYLH